MSWHQSNNRGSHHTQHRQPREGPAQRNKAHHGAQDQPLLDVAEAEAGQQACSRKEWEQKWHVVQYTPDQRSGRGVTWGWWLPSRCFHVGCQAAAGWWLPAASAPGCWECLYPQHLDHLWLVAPAAPVAAAAPPAGPAACCPSVSCRWWPPATAQLSESASRVEWTKGNTSRTARQTKRNGWHMHHRL